MTLSDHADQRKQTWYNEIILQTEYQRSQVQVVANPAKRVMWHPVQLLQHPRILPCFHFNVQPVLMLLFKVTGFLHQSTNTANYSGQPYEHSENNTENVETGKCPKHVPLGLI